MSFCLQHTCPLSQAYPRFCGHSRKSICLQTAINSTNISECWLSVPVPRWALRVYRCMTQSQLSNFWWVTFGHSCEKLPAPELSLTKQFQQMVSRHHIPSERSLPSNEVTHRSQSPARRVCWRRLRPANWDRCRWRWQQVTHGALARRGKAWEAGGRNKMKPEQQPRQRWLANKNT